MFFKILSLILFIIIIILAYLLDRYDKLSREFLEDIIDLSCKNMKLRKEIEKKDE